MPEPVAWPDVPSSKVADVSFPNDGFCPSLIVMLTSTGFSNASPSVSCIWTGTLIVILPPLTSTNVPLDFKWSNGSDCWIVISTLTSPFANDDGVIVIVTASCPPVAVTPVIVMTPFAPISTLKLNVSPSDVRPFNSVNNVDLTLSVIVNELATKASSVASTVNCPEPTTG